MSAYNIPDIFKSEDIVYHYCDLKTAIEFILYDKRLRLSHRKKSNDPIERIKPFFSFSSGNFPDVSDEAQHDRWQRSKSIQEKTLAKIHNAKQLCLCMNDQNVLENNTYSRYLPDEYYGFLKPRMWDQYADRYKGVCLAFSLQELKRISDHFICEKINYIDYKLFELNHNSIDEIQIEKTGVDVYWLYYSKMIEHRMFNKHVDYKNENEYRFLSFSENEFDFIDIESALKGIIVSDTYTSQFAKNALNDYADQYNVDLLNIIWMDSGFSIVTKEQNAR